MPSHSSLDAAAQERKARLAKLKSLKRKDPSADDSADTDLAVIPNDGSLTAPSYLSGRNYDTSTGGVKLGFENSPAADQDTLELRAERLAADTKAKAAEEAKQDKPLDLFKLQPKKPNWDLKRDLDKKLEILNARTDNAIAKLVRERIESAKKAALAKSSLQDKTREGDAEEVGIEGDALVEALKVREREEEEDTKRSKNGDDIDAL